MGRIAVFEGGIAAWECSRSRVATAEGQGLIVDKGLAYTGGVLSVDIRSQRVRLREWQRADMRAMDTWPPFNDPLDQIWNLPRSVTVGHDGTFDDDWGYERRTWAIESWQGHIIGRISLREIEPRIGQARLGISMGSPYVSQGLGSEALELFLSHYFGTLGFSTMVLDVAAPNLRAVRCYRRLGFRTIDDDWREVPLTVDLRFLDRPEYVQLQSFFRFGRRQVLVQFYEMELSKEEWLRQVASLKH